MSLGEFLKIKFVIVFRVFHFEISKFEIRYRFPKNMLDFMYESCSQRGTVFVGGSRVELLVRIWSECVMVLLLTIFCLNVQKYPGLLSCTL